MKKQSAFFSATLTLVVMALVVFGMAGCDTDGNESDGGEPNLTVPKTGDLPEFPNGSSGVSTTEAAQAILEALAKSSTFNEDGLLDEMFAVTNADVVNNSIDIKDKTDNNLKVSAKGGWGTTYSSSMAFMNQSDWDLNGISEQTQFAISDYYRNSQDYKISMEITADKKYGDVTIVKGSTYTQGIKDNPDLSVTTAGDKNTAKLKETGTWDFQETLGFTVVNSTSSIKVILDAKYYGSYTSTNLTFEDYHESL